MPNQYFTEAVVPPCLVGRQIIDVALTNFLPLETIMAHNPHNTLNEGLHSIVIHTWSYLFQTLTKNPNLYLDQEGARREFLAPWINEYIKLRNLQLQRYHDKNGQNHQYLIHLNNTTLDVRSVNGTALTPDDKRDYVQTENAIFKQFLWPLSNQEFMHDKTHYRLMSYFLRKLTWLEISTTHKTQYTQVESSFCADQKTAEHDDSKTLSYRKGLNLAYKMSSIHSDEPDRNHCTGFHSYEYVFSSPQPYGHSTNMRAICDAHLMTHLPKPKFFNKYTNKLLPIKDYIDHYEPLFDFIETARFQRDRTRDLQLDLYTLQLLDFAEAYRLILNEEDRTLPLVGDFLAIPPNRWEKSQNCKLLFRIISMHPELYSRIDNQPHGINILENAPNHPQAQKLELLKRDYELFKNTQLLNNETKEHDSFFIRILLGLNTFKQFLKRDLFTMPVVGQKITIQSLLLMIGMMGVMSFFFPMMLQGIPLLGSLIIRSFLTKLLMITIPLGIYLITFFGKSRRELLRNGYINGLWEEQWNAIDSANLQQPAPQPNMNPAPAPNTNAGNAITLGD